MQKASDWCMMHANDRVLGTCSFMLKLTADISSSKGDAHKPRQEHSVDLPPQILPGGR